MNTAADKTIEQGRMALEALRSRELAAKCHAAAMELQIALSEAEAGNSSSVSTWLVKHHDLIADFPDFQLQFAAPPFASEQVGSTKVVDHRSHSNEVSFESEVAIEAEPLASPWSGMLAGARIRARAGGAVALEPTTTNSVASRYASETLDGDEVETLPAQARDASPSDAAAESSLSPEESSSNETLSELDDPSTSRADDALPPLPLAITVVLAKPADDDKKSWRKLVWLSPSLLGSTIAHVVAVVVMSAYVIQMASKTEPKSIVASTAETQEVSMEAPMEFSAPDAELETSEPTVPTLPSFAAQPTEATSSSIELPASMVGVGLPASPTGAGDSAEQATAATTNNNRMPTNAAQFFGVKAAGNTFCYVVDSSPSMRNDNAFAAAKAELVRSLSALKPKQRFHISFFAKEIEDLALDGRTPETFPVYATAENIQKAIAWIERVRVQDNGKAPNDVLEKAIRMDPDGIFLLFDGDTTVDVPAFLRKVNRTNDIISGTQPLVPIHTLGFYNDEHQAVMKRIADENLGSFRFVPNPTRKK